MTFATYSEFFSRTFSETFSNKMFSMVAITNVALLSDFFPGDECDDRTVALLQLFQHEVLEEILPELLVLKR